MPNQNTALLGGSQLAVALIDGLESLGHSVSAYQKYEESNLDLEAANFNLVAWVQDMPGEPTPLVEQSESDWMKYCEAETKSAIDTSKSFYEELKVTSGALVFIIPNIGMGGAEGFTASAGASESIRILSKSLARLWGKDGIRVHCLALHPTHFLGNKELGEALGHSMSLATPAFETIGEPETDIAQTLDLLTHKEANFLTGNTFCADGGAWMA